MIYFVRHGQSEGNVHKTFTPLRELVSLTEKGKEQAREVGKSLSKVKFDRAFSSPLLRAVQTAELILGDKYKGEIVHDERIIERDLSNYAGVRYEDTNEGKAEFDILGSYDTNREKEFNCETLGQIKARVFPFIDELKQKYPHENILCTSHHDVMILVNAYIHGEPADGNYVKPIYHTKNCGIVMIEN